MERFLERIRKVVDLIESESGQTLTLHPTPVCLLPPSADMTPLLPQAAMCPEADIGSRIRSPRPYPRGYFFLAFS
jgi:hypothetical protein